MHALVIGLGSIGRRHFQNLRTLGCEAISVVTRKAATARELGADAIHLDLETALRTRVYEVAFLCTPTALHLEGLRALLDARVERIYTEKPVSHSLEGVEAILDRHRSSPSQVVVGYDLRFDPGLGQVREAIGRGAIGQVLSANAVVGQYLPDWRPQEDYRQGMSARRALGGGVMLDLVHEFDYLFHLVGRVRTVGCFCRTTGSLEIETEDLAEVLLEFESDVLASVHLDYLQRKLVRHCLITGSEGTIFWDLAKSQVALTTARGTEVQSYAAFQRNDRFLAILKTFLEEPGDRRLCSLEDGVESLRVVEAAKAASRDRALVCLR